MLGMEYQDGTYYTGPKIFKVKATNLIITNVKHQSGKYNMKFETKDLEVDICSKYYNQSDILEKNLVLPIDSLWCVKPGQANIQGYWGTSGIYSNVKVSFTKCKNKTDNNFNCKSQEEIDKTIQSGFISVDYTIIEPNQKNVTHPFHRVFYDNYNLLNANASLQYAVDLRTQQFKSDEGLMFKNINIYEGFTHELKIFNSLVRDENIFNIEFHGSHTGKIFLSSYTKLQTVITQIGGFVNLIMIMGKVISTKFSKNLFFIHYLFENNIYEVKHEYNKISSLKNKQDINSLTLSNTTSIGNITLKKNSRVEEKNKNLCRKEIDNINILPKSQEIDRTARVLNDDVNTINTENTLYKKKSGRRIPQIHRLDTLNSSKILIK